MFNNLIAFDAEFYIFLIIEILLITGYFIFYKFSRNHGGVFDRRINERRLFMNRGTARANDRRILTIGFSNVKVELAGTNETIEVNTERRLSDRRVITDRRRV
ncbi:MAG: hypothetical protein V1874_02355 [Spirochaetota bacterium]